eukprot:m.243351 g.243351  ORF g.243351 m.243351 type:complete len:262 (-) comp17140_c0_seq1:2771-3556(-)
MDDLEKMKVSDLKAKLKEKGLDTSGKKADLIARLKDHEEAELLGIAGDEPLADVDMSLTEVTEPLDEEEGIEAEDEEEEEEPEGEEETTTATPTTVKTTTTTVAKAPAATQAETTASEGGQTAAERRAARAARFGVPTKEDLKSKRVDRAKRFGLVTKEVQDEKRQQRAERFGATTQKGSKATAAPLSEEEKAKRAERAKRFGIKTQDTSPKKPKTGAAEKDYSTMSLEELQRLKTRLTRFGTADQTVIQKIDAALATKTA